MSIGTAPLVSIVIPVYNAEKFIREAVTSALTQTYKNIEVIVVDDGSSDHTLSILEGEYAALKGVRVLTHPENGNHGVSKSRSLGIKESLGEYVAYLDADDLFIPSKIEVQLKLFHENPSVVLVHSCVEFRNEGVAEAGFYNEFRSFDEDRQYSLLDGPYLKKNRICNSTVMVKKSFLTAEQNSFSQVFQYEDWVNWILLSMRGSFYYLNQPLAIYRYHALSSTYDLVTNKLKPVYAKLEMLFILASRVTDKKMKRLIYEDIDRQLAIGIQNYSEKQLPKSFNLYYFYVVGSKIKKRLNKYLIKTLPFLRKVNVSSNE